MSTHRVSPVKWVHTTTDDYPGEVWGATESGASFTGRQAEEIIMPREEQYNRFEFGEGDSLEDPGMWHGDAPAVGGLICGDPVGPAGSKHFRSWFKCDDKVAALLGIIRDGTTMTEHELGAHFAGE